MFKEMAVLTRRRDLYKPYNRTKGQYPAKIFLIFLRILLGLPLFLGVFLSCRTQEARVEKVSRTNAESPRAILLLDTAPRRDVPIFYGVSPRLSNRKEEMTLALQDAAFQAVRFMGLKAEARLLEEKAGGSALVFTDLKVEYDETLEGELAEKLTVMEEYQDQEGTYILAALSGYSLSLPHLPGGFIRGEPFWISAPPVIPGYRVGVGAATKRRLFRDSIRAADDKALEELLKQISLNITAGIREYSSAGQGTDLRQSGYEHSQAEIEGFYILARFVSPEGRYFYSLAVCRIP